MGGFGLTYTATEGRWNFEVCVKEYFPPGSVRRKDGSLESADGVEAFRDEAATLARFNHPGIVHVLGFFDENNTSYLVQELLRGTTLSDALKSAGKMDEPTVLQVAQQLGQALLMVHAAGLVHSDLKPDNLFLTDEGRYVLLDFGLTRGFLSAAGSHKGARGLSLGYAPPEQYRADQDLTPASDVYGFAATLYALLTGSPPPDAQERLKGLVLPPLEGVSGKVDKAITAGLTLDKARRTQGVRELLHQLGLDSTPKAVSYRPPGFRPRAQARAHTAALALGEERLYTGGREGTLTLWSWPDLQKVSEAKGHDRPVTALALSADGRYLVSGSEGGVIKLWAAALGGEGVTLAREDAICTGLKFFGDWVGATFADGHCCLLQPALQEPVRWMAHAGPCNSLDCDPTGSFLVTAGEDGLIRCWEYPDPQIICELKGHDKSVQCAYFTHDGTSVVSASADHTVKFWDMTYNRVLREFKRHNALVFQAMPSCKPHLLISLSADHALRGLDLNGGQVALLTELRRQRAKVMAVDPNRPLVVVGGDDGELTVFEF